MASPTGEPGRASSATPSKHSVLHQVPGRSSTPRSATVHTPPAKLDDDTIEDVIQRATAAAGAGPPPGKDTRTQLFVGNLPYRVRWQDLKDLFRKAGTVLRADVSLGPDNRSRGYGTVLLASAEDAGKATDMYNGYVWQNRTLEVRPDRLPPEFDMGLNHNNPSLLATIPVSNPLVPLAVPQPGHAVDPLTRPMSAALSAPDTAPSPGFFAPSPFGPGPPNWGNSGAHASIMNRQLFVGNLPFQCQWQDLKDLFRTAGQILRADVALGPDGRSRGFGTVVYAKESDAARAVGMFNGYDHNGRVLKVHYDRYSPTNQSEHLSPNSMHAAATGQIGMMVPPQLQLDMLGPSGHHPGGMHLTMPQTPEYMIFPSHSQPTSPYEQYPMGMQQMHAMMANYDRNGVSPPPGGRGMMDGRMGSPPGSPHMYGPSSPHMHQQQNANHPHPGPISLPPAGVGQFPPASALSPLLTRAGGLPPMTPSMPGFNFNPQTATPPLHAHFLSPGLGPFSPQLHSPPFLPAAHVNPYLNPAPGAPPRLPNAPGSLFGNGPGAFGMHHAPSAPSGLHAGYFPPPQAESGYFVGARVNEGGGEKEQGNESIPPSEGSQLGLDSVPTGSTATSFDVEDGLSLQLREVKLDKPVPVLVEAPKRPGLGQSRSSLPDAKRMEDRDASESALALTPQEDEELSVLGLGLAHRVKAGAAPVRGSMGSSEELVLGAVGSGDRRASWNATTSRSKAGVQAPVRE